MFLVDGGDKARRSLDEVDEGAHGDVDSLTLKLQPNAVQGHQHAKFHRDQPSQEAPVVERPLARHRRHLGGGGQTTCRADHPLPLDDSAPDVGLDHRVETGRLDVLAPDLAIALGAGADFVAFDVLG